jgi:outer membrane protein assembly factor BamE (lipoprotein component of BamABCDE complex)
MKVFRVRCAIIGFFILVPACATVEVGQKFDTSAVDKIIVGKTTESEVLSLLGEPLKKTINADGTKKFGYAHVESKARAVPFAARGTVSGDKLVLTFDKNGVVASMDTGMLPGDSPSRQKRRPQPSSE